MRSTFTRQLSSSLHRTLRWLVLGQAIAAPLIGAEAPRIGVDPTSYRLLGDDAADPLPAGDSKPIEPPLPDPLAAGWQGQQVCERLHEDLRLRVLRCTFAPGVGHERHFHAPHFGYVIAGERMRITDASGTREVDTSVGGSWTSGAISWHEVRNVGDTTAVYLIVEPK